MLRNVVNIPHVLEISPQHLKSMKCSRVRRRTNRESDGWKSFNFIRCEILLPFTCMCVSVPPLLSVHHYHCRYRCMVSVCACEEHVSTNTFARTHHYIDVTATNTGSRKFNASDDCCRSISSFVTIETPTRPPISITFAIAIRLYVIRFLSCASHNFSFQFSGYWFFFLEKKSTILCFVHISLASQLTKW